MTEQAEQTTGTGIDDAAVAELRGQFRGELLREGDPGYDKARSVWNGMIDRRPALIARCTGTADVVAAVNFGRERGMLVSVRSGGHGVGGQAVAGGGPMIGLLGMRGLLVELEARSGRLLGGEACGGRSSQTA